jgi:cobalt-zinc-cadmium efflux system membrane fusion protein
MALLAVLWLSGCARETPVQAKPEPEKAAPARGEVEMSEAAQKEARIAVRPAAALQLARTVRAEGRITMNEERTWRAAAIVEGRLLRVAARLGDRVKEGQVLAGMHSHDIHESRAVYRNTRIAVANKTGAVEYARRARDRARRLYELKAGSLADLEHAETALRNAQAELETALSEERRARVHLVEYLQVSLEDHPEEDTEHEEDLIPIKAPRDGVVVAREASVGMVVHPGTPLFTVSDLSTVWMMAQFPAEHLPFLRVGLAARVFEPAHPETVFAGRVTRIGEEFDAATRTATARIELPNRGGRLKPEMYAAVEVDAGPAAAVVGVPADALQDVNGQTVVFVRRSATRFETRPVRAGRRSGEMVEILSGLAAGEPVVAEGAFRVKSQLLLSSLGGEE